MYFYKNNDIQVKQNSILSTDMKKSIFEVINSNDIMIIKILWCMYIYIIKLLELICALNHMDINFVTLNECRWLGIISMVRLYHWRSMLILDK